MPIIGDAHENTVRLVRAMEALIIDQPTNDVHSAIVNMVAYFAVSNEPDNYSEAADLVTEIAADAVRVLTANWGSRPANES